MHLFTVMPFVISRSNCRTNPGQDRASPLVPVCMPAGHLRAMSPSAPASFCIDPQNVTHTPTSLENLIHDSILAL